MSTFSIRFSRFLKAEITKVKSAMDNSSEQEKNRLKKIHRNMNAFLNLLKKKKEAMVTVPGEIFLCKEGFEVTQCPCKFAHLCDSMQKEGGI